MLGRGHDTGDFSRLAVLKHLLTNGNCLIEELAVLFRTLCRSFHQLFLDGLIDAWDTSHDGWLLRRHFVHQCPDTV